MFDAPIDAWYVWLGVSVVSLATFGVAVGLPSAAPPPATAVADAIDEVATSPPGSTDTHKIDADELWLDRRQVGLRGPGGTAHASVVFGPITPAVTDDRLERVLQGASPSATFDSPVAFDRSTTEARQDATDWRPAPERLVIRRVTWEGTDVVLVG
jgi:hypothetical protein